MIFKIIITLDDYKKKNVYKIIHFWYFYITLKTIYGEFFIKYLIIFNRLNKFYSHKTKKKKILNPQLKTSLEYF